MHAACMTRFICMLFWVEDIVLFVSCISCNVSLLLFATPITNIALCVLRVFSREKFCQGPYDKMHQGRFLLKRAIMCIRVIHTPMDNLLGYIHDSGIPAGSKNKI